MTASKILDRLWLGSWHDAQKANEMTIITVAEDSKFKGDYVFPLSDAGNKKTDFDLFYDAITCISRIFYMSKENILIHCVSGVNRSSSVVIAFIIQQQHKSLFEAFEFVKTARPHIFPAKQWLQNICRYYGLDKPEIVNQIRKIRPPLPKTKEEKIVNNAYRTVLKRPPDPTGLDHYSTLLYHKRMSPEYLETILKRSTEYKEKFGET